MTGYGKKGVVVFIVEGVSDKIALELPMSRLICSDSIRFAVMHGDCLSRSGNGAEKAVSEQIRTLMVKYNYKKSDFVQIVHIVDTDGSFIPDDRVFSREQSGIAYYSDRIETGEYKETVARHHRRRNSALVLAKKKSIMGIPYDIYFMSRNLEHVTQNEGGHVRSSNKVEFAERFADSFADDPYGLMELLCDKSVAAKGDYDSSWNHIMSGTNSLKKCSNLNFFLDSYYNEIYSESE
ncbi:MAG: hypothetical protein IJO93_05825 [Clostridia bacterium]|nr:hypothetical protein [Clostridia bacterium]